MSAIPTSPLRFTSLLKARRIWIGSAGAGSSYGIIRAVRARWPTSFIVAADTNPRRLVAATAFADSFEQVTEATEPGFVPALVARMAFHSIGVYVPIVDPELLVAATAFEAQAFPDSVQTTVPPSETVATCNDKLLTVQVLRAAGISTPRTWLPSEPILAEAAANVIIKPRQGFGSRNVSTVAVAEFDPGRFTDDDFVVQEQCRPPEVTIDVFRSRSSGVERALCRERIEVKAGVCTKARIFEDPDLASLALAVGQILRLFGAYCIQVMTTPDGVWGVTDVNPRPGSGTRMCSAVGYDFLAAHIGDLWEEDCSSLLNPMPQERFVVRQYEEFVT